MRNLITNRRGTSLIEILTTLAILVVGILSVARMFSGGFVVLKRSENVTVAGRLAEKEMERLRGRAASLPLGVVLIDDPALELPHPGPPLTDMNRKDIRQIIGEPVKIPGPSLDQGSTGVLVGSVYTLAFAPVARIDSVYSARMQRVQVNSDNNDNAPWNWLRVPSYAIDYDAGLIAFRSANYDRVFSLSYSYWTSDDTGRHLHVVSALNLDVPANAEWINIPGLTKGNVTEEDDFTEIDEGSEYVARGFDLIPDAANWSAGNPYQFKVPNALTGRLIFNPNGYAFKEQTPSGTQELVAHIDYTLVDWGIVSETLQVPENGQLRVRTTLRNIKQSGITVEGDGSVYNGIVPTSPPLGLSDVIVVDEATGAIIPVAFTADPNAVRVDYINGILEFPAQVTAGNQTLSMAGQMVRVYYRAESEWQVQVQKAFESYSREYNAGISYREFRLRPDSDTDLLVSKIDCAKTFSVDYVGLDANDQPVNITGEVVRATDGAPVRHGAQDCAVLTLRNRIQDHESVRVRGISVKVRVLWSEGSRLSLTQGIIPRWHYYDLDSNLTRKLSTL